MPISYSLETSGIDVHVKIAGKVSPQDLIAYMRDLMLEFETLDGKRALIEVVSITPDGFRYASMRDLAAQTKRFEPRLNGSRTAIFAESPIAFGLARMYTLTRNPPYAMSVFREREAALRWLLE